LDGQIWNRVGDNEPIDERARDDLLRMVAQASAISYKLTSA
jgi:hypothetical protein